MSRAPLLLAAAIGLELRPLLRRLGDAVPAPEFGRGVWRATVAGRPVVVVRGGVGPLQSAATAERVLSKLGHCEGVINVGIAGALSGELKIGEVVVPGGGVDTGGAPAWSITPRLAELLGGAGPRRSVSIPQPAWTAQAKAALRNSCGADLCEMEGSQWAAAAATHHFPFAAVRAISDTAEHDMPDLGRLGDPSAPWRSLWRLAHPRVWWALPALAGNAKTAAEAAAVFLVSNLSRR